MKLKIAVFLTIVTAFVAVKSTATTCEGKPPKVKTASGVVLLRGKPLAGVSRRVIGKTDLHTAPSPSHLGTRMVPAS